MKNETRKLTIGALFIALGVLFPYVMGHAVGIPGGVLLPMHVPVLIGGILLGPKLGLAIGILSPIASSLLTGMPPLWPMLPQMIFELGAFGLVGGFIRKNLKSPQNPFHWGMLQIYASLIGAMIVGRIVRGIVFAAIMQPMSAGMVMESIVASTILGVPGIIIQLAFVPITVWLLEKHLKIGASQNNTIPRTNSTSEVKRPLPPSLNDAIAEITAKKHSFILIKNDEIIYRTSGRGVRPFLDLLETEEGRQMLEGAIVVDKLIGKGAAMLAVYGKASSVYGVTMSDSGKAFLEQHDKLNGFTRCVEVISQRDGKGLCPIERSVLDVEDPAQAYENIKATIAELMKKAE